MSNIKVHTITKPVWDMTGGEKRKYAQKDHPEFLIDIVKKSDHDEAIQALTERAEAAEGEIIAREKADIESTEMIKSLQSQLAAKDSKLMELAHDCASKEIAITEKDSAITKLRTALEWYADKKNYTELHDYKGLHKFTNIGENELQDNGQVASKALKETSGV